MEAGGSAGERVEAMPSAHGCKPAGGLNGGRPGAAPPPRGGARLLPGQGGPRGLASWGRGDRAVTLPTINTANGPNICNDSITLGFTGAFLLHKLDPLSYRASHFLLTKLAAGHL